jgi:glycosyltransferase involved in cell wall biosynthesis
MSISSIEMTHSTDTQTLYTPKQRLKLLISAYACAPGRGSEHGNAWNPIIEMSEYHDIWVMVNEEYRADIEKHIAKNPLPSVHWVFHDLPRWAVSWRKPQQLERIHYYLWQQHAAGVAKRLHEQIKFDASMHLTFGSYWRPSFLRLLPIPFIWGPTGGAENVPEHFYPSLDPASVSWDKRKRLIESLACKFDPTVRGTAAKAALTLVPTQNTADRVRELGAKRVIVMPQNALPMHELERFADFPIRQDPSPVRFISLGRMLGWKGIHIAVRAFAKLLERCPNAEYWHDGGGVLAEDIQKLATDLGIGDKFKLFLNNPRAAALENLKQSDVLMHPSLHDEPAWVALEGMAAGRPIVYLLGKPQVEGGENTGLFADSSSIDAAINSMADCMYRLATDAELRESLAKSARKVAWAQYSSKARSHTFMRYIDELVAEKR